MLENNYSLDHSVLTRKEKKFMHAACLGVIEWLLTSKFHENGAVCDRYEWRSP